MIQLLRRQAEEATWFSTVFGNRHGLHQTDVAALGAIAQASSEGAPIGPAKLAETLHLSRPATTALVDRLVAARHVVRHPDPVDRRRTTLELQAEAMELAAAFFGRLGVAYAEVMDRFTPEELSVVESFLGEIVDATVATRIALADPAAERPAASGEAQPDGAT
jgi:DNA-binding MarR family transcriptional regulator